MCTPTHLADCLRDQAPAAHTTVLVAMRPCAVTTSGERAAAALDVGDRAVPDDAGTRGGGRLAA